MVSALVMVLGHIREPTAPLGDVLGSADRQGAPS